jgi:hypothetical protein
MPRVAARPNRLCFEITRELRGTHPAAESQSTEPFDSVLWVL